MRQVFIFHFFSCLPVFVKLREYIKFDIEKLLDSDWRWNFDFHTIQFDFDREIKATKHESYCLYSQLFLLYEAFQDRKLNNVEKYSTRRDEWKLKAVLSYA